MILKDKNVYLDAQNEWNERYGSYISQVFTWKIVSLGFAIIALSSVGGMIYSASQNKFIPYIVEVDKLGAAVNVYQAHESKINYGNKVIKYNLAEFIKNYRTVYSDKDVQISMIKKAYNYVSSNSPAYNMLSESYIENSPFDNTNRVQVKILSVLPLSETTWQIDWIEKVFQKNGTLAETNTYKGIGNIVINAPKSEQSIFNNPLGLFIVEFNFTKQMK